MLSVAKGKSGFGSDSLYMSHVTVLGSEAVVDGQSSLLQLPLTSDDKNFFI